jgi:hypothetical protein
VNAMPCLIHFIIWFVAIPMMLLTSCSGCGGYGPHWGGGGWGRGGWGHHRHYGEVPTKKLMADPNNPHWKTRQLVIPPTVEKTEAKPEPKTEQPPLGSTHKVKATFAVDQYKAPVPDGEALTPKVDPAAPESTKIDPKPEVKPEKPKPAAEVPKKLGGKKCCPDCICEGDCCCEYDGQCLFRHYDSYGIDKIVVKTTAGASRTYSRPRGRSLLLTKNDSGWISSAWLDSSPQVFAAKPIQKWVCDGNTCHLEDTHAMTAGTCGSGSCSQGSCQSGYSGQRSFGMFRIRRGCRGCGR